MDGSGKVIRKWSVKVQAPRNQSIKAVQSRARSERVPFSVSRALTSAAARESERFSLRIVLGIRNMSRAGLLSGHLERIREKAQPAFWETQGEVGTRKHDRNSGHCISIHDPTVFILWECGTGSALRFWSDPWSNNWSKKQSEKCRVLQQKTHTLTWLLEQKPTQ